MVEEQKAIRTLKEFEATLKWQGMYTRFFGTAYKALEKQIAKAVLVMAENECCSYFCPTCANQIRAIGEGARFCGSCGQHVKLYE